MVNFYLSVDLTQQVIFILFIDLVKQLLVLLLVEPLAAEAGFFLYAGLQL